MGRLAVSFVFFAMLLFSIQKSYSKTSHSMDLELEPYIEFIVEWSRYSYSGEQLPKIKPIRHELVQIFAYGDYEYAQAEAKNIKLSTVNSVYDQKRKTIYISERIDPTSDDFKLAILHELVHYLQDISGYTDSLNGHLICTESEAYDIQMLYQTIHEIKKEEVLNVYKQSLLAATRCMGQKSHAFPRYEP